MNQQCKVCGEPAAGFHFGAFTCEGCKSFFGRSYNNLGSISECKNNGECVINKKNRTACKACRLRKCLLVGMSKSGSRYGRRSNWFKIHCLLQEQQQAAAQAASHQSSNHGTSNQPQKSPPPQHMSHHQSLASGFGLLGPPHGSPFSHPHLLPHLPRTKEELLLLGLDDYKHHHHSSTSPSVSSPESHNSDSSVEISDARRHGLMFPGMIPPHFLPPPGLLFPPGYPHPLYSGLLQPSAQAMACAALNNNNNNTKLSRNNNTSPSNGIAEVFSKRVFLDAVLQSQRSPTPIVEEDDRVRANSATPTASEVSTPAVAPSPIQDNPIDLSMKSDRGSSPANSEHSATNCSTPTLEDRDEDESDNSMDSESSLNESKDRLKRIKLIRPTPLDLTTKV